MIDEAGICVWNEAIGWHNSAEHLNDPCFMAALHAHIDEMVAASYNHPSVIMWGVLNEGFSDDPQWNLLMRYWADRAALTTKVW